MDTKEGNVPEEMKNREEYSGEFQKIEFLSDAVKNMDLTDGKSGTIVISSEKTEEELNIFQQDLSRIHLTEKPDKKYKFRRSIGAGGMKMVLQVQDQDTMRDVALAMMPDIERRSKHEILRFIQEARLTASLEHPNIVPVYDIGMDSTGSPYYTMKLLRGETLASLLKKMDAGDPAYRKRYSFEKLMRLFLRICSGVGFAHSKNVVHLDLKPENVQIGDFSEVLILDWGIAKYLDQSASSGKQNTGSKKGFSRFKVAEDDGMKGSPGYMAPEQITGNNSAIGVQTDIYALGAILYSMVTYKSPAAASTVKKILQDTLKGNIIPPGKRAPSLEIPYGIEAVIMKAMNSNAANRYASVKELRDDVAAFIDGFATEAEKAGVVKKSLLFFRRHFLISLSIMFSLIMLLGIAFYAAIEIPRWHSDWIRMEEYNFMHKEPDLSRMEFRNILLQKNAPSWHWIKGKGLRTREGEWLILRHKVPGNVRVELTLEIPAITDTFEICLNAGTDKPLRDWWQSPDSYSFRIAESNGEKDCIVKSSSGRRIRQEYIGSAENRTLPGSVIKVTAERIDEVLTLKINDREHVRAVDYFPQAGKNLAGIGLRSYSGRLIVRNISVYKLALPEKTTPLIAGDTLVELQQYDLAIEKYLAIASSYGKGTLAEKALLKAYMTAASKVEDRKKRMDYLLEIKRLISIKFYNYKYLQQTMEMDAWILWREGRHKEALLLAERVLRMMPDSRVMTDIICLHHSPLDPSVLHDFFRLLRKTKNITSLDLSGYGLTSLEPLNGMKLTFLDCSNNYLESLNGIERMPLNVLVCRNNRLEDISAVRSLPLKSFSCDNNNISDLTPLAGLPVTFLDCSDNRLSSLEAVKDLPLEKLVFRDNNISDLTVLSGMHTLKVLDAGKNAVQDLSPLSGLPLERLRLDATLVSDLTALSDLPLSLLSLNDCRRLKDLTPLGKIRTLRFLTIPSGTADDAENVRVLKTLPELKYISFRNFTSRLQLEDGDTVHSFWKSIEKNKKQE